MRKVKSFVEINAPAETCFEAWCDFESFPSFMRNVLSVTKVRDNVWHWKVRGPLGRLLEWDAHIDMVIEDKVISWHTVGEHDSVDHSGSVNFIRMNDKQTRILVDMAYSPPFTTAGEMVATIIKNPSDMLTNELNRFKQYIETDYIKRSAQVPV